MTSQLRDTVRHRGEVHELAACDGTGLFDPSHHGLPVVMASTACWRGHLCDYAIAETKLQLDRLQAMAGRYQDEVFRAVTLPAIHGRAGIAVRPPPFNARYEALALPIAFTGQLLIGAGPNDSVIQRLGGAPAWVYDRVHALRFAGGTLVLERDLSAAMHAMRARYAEHGVIEVPASLRPADHAWIVDSFAAL